MAINVINVQYNGRFLPDITLLTLRYHWGTRSNAMKMLKVVLRPSLMGSELRSQTWFDEFPIENFKKPMIRGVFFLELGLRILKKFQVAGQTRLGIWPKFLTDSWHGRFCLETSPRGSCAASWRDTRGADRQTADLSLSLVIAAVARPSLITEESVRHADLSQCYHWAWAIHRRCHHVVLGLIVELEHLRRQRLA